MKVEQVDERTSRWEIDYPVFRVYMFRETASGGSWSTAVFDIRDADLLAVAEWARGQAGSSRLFSIAAVTEDNGETGLLWLIGNDANRADAEQSGWYADMIKRRDSSGTS